MELHYPSLGDYRTDNHVLARVTFLRVSGEALEQSIQRLARVATST